jgi:hypothetical protein
MGVWKSISCASALLSTLSIVVDAGGDILPTTTLGLDRGRPGSEPFLFGVWGTVVEGGATAVVSEATSTDSCEVSSAGASDSCVDLAVFFFCADAGAAFLGLLVCVGVSSDSNSRFPAVFRVELRGVGVGPGVSVPPRVVTMMVTISRRFETSKGDFRISRVVF